MKAEGRRQKAEGRRQKDECRRINVPAGAADSAKSIHPSSFCLLLSAFCFRFCLLPSAFCFCLPLHPRVILHPSSFIPVLLLSSHVALLFPLLFAAAVAQPRIGTITIRNLDVYSEREAAQGIF